ncbi:MAG: sulfatase [Bacteroidota bacterium]
MTTFNRFFILLPLFLLLSCQTEVPPKQQPNVLFILADDLGYHDLSCTGSQYYETPNIDQIANRGMTFTNGYAACQVCSPSRAAIMTGKYPARLKITDWIGAKTGEAWRQHNRHNKLLPAENKDHLPFEDISLAEAVKEVGYKTFFAGKWHIGSEGSYPEDHGFDINKGGWEKGSPIGGFYAPWTNPRLESKQDGESLTLRLGEETANFIKNNADAPFLAYLSFYAVHGPIQTTKEKWRKYRDKAASQGVADSGYIMEHFLPIRQVQDNPVYAGLVETMDDAVGLVLQALKEAGIDDNTIIVFTSDNGGVASGDAYSTSNLPLRGGKGYQWEGGIKEPYFIRVPWMNHNGAKTDEKAIGMDFYPTILDLLDIPLKPNQHMDGVSLRPVLEGNSLSERALFWHYPHYGNQGGEPSSIMRDGEWKLIHYYEDGRDELYNLKSDPGEQTNVAEQHSDILKQMRPQLDAWLVDMDAWLPQADPEYNDQLAKERYDKMVNEWWPTLEQRRLDFLSDEYDPDNNWWDSALGSGE